MPNNIEKNKKPIYKKWWFWLIIIILFLGIYGSETNNRNNIINTSEDNKVENSSGTETNTSLSGTNGKDFFNILCEVAEVEPTSGVEIGNFIVYKASNSNYSIEVETNKSDEIYYIKMMATQTDDYKNFFIAATRLEYNGYNRANEFNWINSNLGKETSTKIGDANFKLYNNTLGKPVLEIYTDGNENFQK